jgi:ABC-type polysaccharide/polyol phosphate transport system ATPase subunit
MLVSERSRVRREPPELEDIVVSVEKLNLVFKAALHRSWTWRDSFTRFSQDPARVLFGREERIHIAKDLSFKLKRKERLGLLGVNGVGKTSLCRCIAGIFRPTSGRVRITGTSRAVFDTHVGIHPELTGRENAHLLCEFLYPELEDRGSLVEEALEFSELGKFVDLPFRLYSNGMQTRLCLSVVTAAPSDLLVLDEVFDGADIFFQRKASERVMKLMKDSGSVIFVSHSEEQIRTACTRVIVLKQGQIAFDGPVEEGLAFYSTFKPRWN